MKAQHFGCWTKGANAAVARLVARIIGRINKAGLRTDAQIATAMRKGLTSIGEGACDTVVKEAVLSAIRPACDAAGIEFDQMLIYGW